jgi:ABC-type multidrug transport system fused ATPase/permease subunit
MSSVSKFLSFQLKVRFYLLIVLMIFSAFAEIMSIGMVIPFLGALTTPEDLFLNPYIKILADFFSIQSNYELVTFVTLVFCCLAIIASMMRLLTLWFQTRFCYSLGAELSIKLYSNSIYQPYSVHLERNSGEFIATIINKTFQSTSFAVLPFLNIVSSGLILIAIMATLLIIEPMIAILAITIFALLYGTIIFFTRSKLDRDSEEINLQQNLVVKKLQEGFGGIRDILISNNQEVYIQSYKDSFISLQNSWSNVEIIKASPRYIVEGCGLVIIALAALFFYQTMGSILSVLPTLGAMALGAQRLLPILQILYSSVSSLRGGYASLVDIITLLNQSPKTHINDKDPRPMKLSRDISVENLTFKYGSSSPLVLDEISFTIPKGSTLGVIGSTGSGKSTLIDIMMGLLSPSNGIFKVDDQAITELNRHSWQSIIAHVPQSIFLIDGSIKENIALGVPKDSIDNELVEESARQAQIHETILSWDGQYDTIVGERGVRISGGQRQRIAIARALYKKASVIIFDEATSALDNETETSVMQAIEGLNEDLTIIIVAHRLTTLKNCSNIIELSNGKIVQQGIYNEIIN